MLNVPITMTTWKLRRQIPTTKTPSPGNGNSHGGLWGLAKNTFVPTPNTGTSDGGQWDFK